MIEQCPCGSQKMYSECCEPIIKGEVEPKTARELLQSRYTAYVKKQVNYIITTVLPRQNEKMDEKSIREWAEKTEWLKLEVLDCQQGGAQDTKGTVEFIAYYKEKEIKSQHHEIAKFEKQQNKWYYADSEFPKPKQIVRETPKTGRNDPCTCGSGKKYKKCCGV